MSHIPAARKPLRIVATPTVEQARILDAMEAAWRVAVTLDSDAQATYQAADNGLLAALTATFGETDGREVRELMADNFEGWAYNVRIVQERHLAKYGTCVECGGFDFEHNGYDDGTPCPAQVFDAPLLVDADTLTAAGFDASLRSPGTPRTWEQVARRLIASRDAVPAPSGDVAEYEVTIENGWAVVTVDAHGPRAQRIAVSREDSEALNAILSRVRRDHVTRDGAR